MIIRLRNELNECIRNLKHQITVSTPQFSRFPVTIYLNLVDTPGPIFIEGKLKTIYTHKLKIVITDDYPYQTPIVRWKSKIFHPNIMDPDDGGYVCTKLLRSWNFSSNLFSFIKGLESLLSNPNPDDPYENDSCTRAAEYFNKNNYVPPDINPRPRKPIKILVDSNED